MIYRPDIDGLRAVAVVSVVLSHASFSLFSGGFVGVDVFFIISGYLITSIIYEEIRSDNFSICTFYRRRIRRIFPALFVLLFFCIVAGFFLLTPTEFQNIGKSAIYSTFFASNILFSKFGYFDSELEPLLHTWSLSVEEQFYIVFPLFLQVVAKFKRHWLWLMAVALIAFVVSEKIVDSRQAAAFYFAPFRAWEFLIGSLLVFTPASQNKKLNECLGGLGLLLILFAVFYYTEETTFPGAAALAPCLGAAFLIHARKSYANTLLSLHPAVFIGLISYSLYLWHWPIIVFYKYYRLDELLAIERVGLVVASILAGFLSWRYVEQPFRKSATGVLRLGALAMACSAAIGVAIITAQGFPGRLDRESLDYLAMIDKQKYFGIYDRGGCFLDYDQGVKDYNAAKCLPKSGGVLIWGDSFAAHYYPGLKQILGDVYQYTATSCRPIHSGKPRCLEFDEELEKTLAGRRFDVVVIAANWPKTVWQLGEGDFSKLLGESITRAKSFGDQVIVIGQTPTYALPVPRYAAFQPGLERLPAKDHSHVNGLLGQISTRYGATFHNPYSGTCNESKCLALAEGMPLHWDFGHLTAEGSVYFSTGLVQTIKVMKN